MDNSTHVATPQLILGGQLLQWVELTIRNSCTYRIKKLDGNPRNVTQQRAWSNGHGVNVAIDEMQTNVIMKLKSSLVTVVILLPVHDDIDLVVQQCINKRFPPLPFLCDDYKTTKLQDRRLVESWKRPQFATLLTAGPHDHIVWWRHHLSITTATSNLSNLQPFNHSTIHHPLNWKAQGTLLFSALSHESCKLMKPLAWPNRRLWNFCCVGS